MTITLTELKAKQTELADLIARFEKAANESSTFTLDGVDIELARGERYAGIVLDGNGQVMHHLILLADKPEDDLNWNDAMAWAEKIGGSLPTRQEQALLFANCKAQFDEAWYWSCQPHETSASYAWSCGFNYGSQVSNRKSYEGRARAVRRFNP